MDQLELNILCSKSDKINKTDCMYMGGVSCLLYFRLKNLGIKLNEVYEEDLPKNNLIHIVEVAVCRNYPFYISNYLKNLEPKILEAIQKNCLFIFDFSKDPINTQTLDDFIFIKGIFSYFNIPLKNVILLLSDYTIQYDKELSVIPMDYWGYIIAKEPINFKTKVQKADLDINKRITNRFLCLNRTIKDSRLLTIGYLHKNNLLDKGIYSLHNIKYLKPSNSKILLSYENVTINPDTITYEDFNKFAYTSTIDPYIKYTLDNYKKFYPKKIDDSIVYDSGHVTKSIASNNIKQHFENSLFSIVTETTIFGVKSFISEKTWLRMLHRHPFLMISTPYHLKILKSLGFKTFDCFIDESYDEIKDNSTRLLKVLEEAERLIKLSDKDWIAIYKDITPILEHNYNLLVTNYYDLLFNKLLYRKIETFYKQ